MGYLNTNIDSFSPAPLTPEQYCPGIGHTGLDGEPLVASITQSTTFSRDSVGSTATHQYSRVSNPTVATLEKALGDLEHALPAACFATGLAAETALFLALLKQGDHVVCGRSVYGGTTRLLDQVLRDLGITSTFVDSTDLDEIRAAVRENTRLIFVETPANPSLDITDIRGIAQIARITGALLAVDNTFQTPVLQQPLDLGADISVYSTTKFIDGHSVALGGALVTRDQHLLDRIRFIRKCTGAIQTPFNAWLTINGLKTLPLRIRQQGANAETVAQWLNEQACIKAVYHPSLATGAARECAEAQHLGTVGKHGAVVTFEVEGGIDAGRAFVESLTLCTLVEHVGSVETLITHPASMTHADVPRDQRLEVGITDGLLRLSVGLEPTDAVIADLARGLEAARACTSAREEASCPAHL
ncbi:MAG: aminotransferase class I/II-fold pyridoxal phosphate-dependent enzyme [Phycisphaeraceae bacterium]|nr:aminotransferase class I/II-fold pyridoxal phosphate-dependent enzyme [Phycisphaerales bacterium]MCB9859201.1 aminotransferase class I/II-fold pyridoxal phosphate-dependent enzyme [Phycisphaeraceae bacterium]